MMSLDFGPFFTYLPTHPHPLLFHMSLLYEITFCLTHLAAVLPTLKYNVIFEHSLAKETDCGETEEESFFPSPVSTWGKAKRKEGSLVYSPAMELPK